VDSSARWSMGSTRALSLSRRSFVVVVPTGIDAERNAWLGAKPVGLWRPGAPRVSRSSTGTDERGADNMRILVLIVAVPVALASGLLGAAVGGALRSVLGVRPEGERRPPPVERSGLAAQLAELGAILVVILGAWGLGMATSISRPLLAAAALVAAAPFAIGATLGAMGDDVAGGASGHPDDAGDGFGSGDTPGGDGGV
jgi:hypothetical protein